MSRYRPADSKASIGARAAARDREWFEQHPERTSYVRQYIPGEFGSLRYAQDAVVLVSLLRPGFIDARSRRVIRDADPELLNKALERGVVLFGTNSTGELDAI
jgi:hypothetical protein